MEPVNLFKLATQQAQWLSVRQAAVAGNIANANTPGYGAVDVVPFETMVNRKPTTLAATHPGHVQLAATNATYTVERFDREAPMLPSGNTVGLEDELMKAGEVRRGMEINTSVVKSFHRMLMMTARP